MFVERVNLALSLMFVAAAPAAAAAPAEPTQPFSVQDMVRMERISDVAVAPDGKHVVYTERTTDMEANKGRTGIWMLDTGKRGATPLRLTDGGPNSNSPEWSKDGKFIYFLSNRSGSNQVWRVSSGGTGPRGDTPVADSTQVTNLPLDVGSFRVSPKGDRILVSIEVFLDCADLDCSKKRLDSVAHSAATGVLHTQLFVRHWDTWSDGRRSQVFAMALNDNGVAHGRTGESDRRYRRCAGQTVRRPRRLRLQSGRHSGGLLGAIRPQAKPGRQTLISIRLPPTAAPRRKISPPTTRRGMDNPLSRPTARNLLTSRWIGQVSRPTGSIWCLLNLQSGVKRALTQNWDRSINSFAWSRDGKTLFATADHLGQRPLWAVDVATGRASAITGAGEVEGFSVGTSKVFYAASNLGSRRPIYIRSASPAESPRNGPA